MVPHDANLLLDLAEGLNGDHRFYDSDDCQDNRATHNRPVDAVFDRLDLYFRGEK